MTGSSRARLLFSAFCHFFRFAPWRLTAIFALMLLQGVSSGIGLLVLLPLLQLLGLGENQGQATGLTRSVGYLFTFFHLQLSLPSILAFYVLLVSGLAGLRYLQTVGATGMQQAYIISVRDTLLRALLHAQWRFVLQRKTSEFIHTLTGQVQTVGLISMQCVQLLSQCVLMATYLLTALLLSWPMTVLALGAALFFLLLLLPLHRKQLASGTGQLIGYKAIFHLISEELASFKMIKSHAGEDLYAEKILVVSRQLERQHLVNTRITALTQMVYMVGAVAVSSGLFYVCYSFLAIEMARLLLLLFIFARLLPQASSLQKTYQMLLHQLPSFADVMTLQAECRRYAEPRAPGRPVSFSSEIRLEDVSFSYLPDRPVISKVNAVIRQRRTVFIGGPSGAGKTTLVDLIAGLLTPDSGRITIDGRPLSSDLLHGWRQGIAYVTQDVFLLHDTIRNNLQWNGTAVPEERVWQVLEDASARSFVRQLPEGLDTVIGDRGIRLSGGERQRIALARALLAEPVLLILDEATSALDSENEEKILDALQRLHGKITIIVISHRDSFQHVADQQILLDSPDHPQGPLEIESIFSS